MNCKITIGNVVVTECNSISIKNTIKELSDIATIVLPREFGKVQYNGHFASFEKQNILQFIKVNDKVSIYLGYDDDLVEEFTGYVTKIGADIPLTLQCEDEMSQLRMSNFTQHWSSVKLLELVQHIAPGYQYEVVDNIGLGAYRINNASAYQVLEDLRQNYGLHARFVGKVLHVGFPVSIIPGTTHQININRNVRAQENDLQYVRKEDVKMLLKAISIDSKTGKRIHYDFGDTNGSVRTLHFCDKTEYELAALTEKQYKSLNFDGYQGSIPTWCIPRTRAGDAMQITDTNYENSERDGKYLIEGVEILFNASDGIKRIVKPGLKL